jgi:uncharacterized membrane protein YoaK (UPF0700 family)
MIRNPEAKPYFLPVGLSVVSGSVDTIGFLAIAGLFTAHVTGNFVMIGVSLATSSTGVSAKLVALPVFIAVVALVRGALLLYSDPTTRGLRLLLILQAAFLLLFLGLGVRHGPFDDPDSHWAVLTGMAGVAAMAVQNAGSRLVLSHMSPTTVMTGNTTQLAIDAVDVLRGKATPEVRARAVKELPPILGFAAGCAIGALSFLLVGFWGLLLPTAIVAALAAWPDLKAYSLAARKS